MLSRQQLELLNRKSLRYPLQIAEKDYMLALVLQLISQSPLGKQLVFKGGTSLHHCYLKQQRWIFLLGSSPYHLMKCKRFLPMLTI